MPAIFSRGNDALTVNAPTGADDALTVNGSDWLWAVTAIYLFVTLAVVCHSYFTRAGEKIFHYLFTISLLTGTVAYFTMASDLGWVAIVQSTGLIGTRQVYYARYINWFIGWTPMIIATSLISGVSWATVAYNVAITWTIATAWLASSVVSDSYKWSYYAFGILAVILLFLSLINPGLKTARRVNMGRQYTGVVAYLCLMYVLYTISHGLDDGNVIGVVETFIFIGVVDLLTVPFLAIVFLVLSLKWDYNELNLQFTQYGRVRQGGWSPEKETPVVAQNTAADVPQADVPENKEVV